MTSWIYGRLYGELLEASYEMEESYVESLDGKGLTCYEDEIQARIEQEQAYGRENGGLAQYLHKDEAAQRRLNLNIQKAFDTAQALSAPAGADRTRSFPILHRPP